MLDLETLATTPDAAILSIGAVRFDLDAGTVFDQSDTFYTAVSIDYQPGRKITNSTLAWWFMQTAEAQEVFFDPTALPLNIALNALATWVGPQPGITPKVWSNGADFYLPMLAHAYAQHGIDLPWQPYSGRCYRTYKNLRTARSVKVERTGEHHNALADAIFQAKHLCAIHQALFVKAEDAAEVAA